MACYHFRIKSDKKPNGMSVSAADHIAYMNRDGRYRNIDHQQELRSGRRDYGNFSAFRCLLWVTLEKRVSFR